MKFSNFQKKNKEYHYQHIYDIFKNYFKFDKNKYEYLIKDIIKVLIEFEKKGETVIDVDKVQINFDLFNEEWPDPHIKCIYDTGLNKLSNSPIIINGRIISWSKWKTKLDRVSEKLINKINIKEIDKLKEDYYKGKTEIDLVKSILNYSNLVLLQGGPGTGKTTLVINLIFNFLQRQTNLNIGLSAPTGKATARIKEALNSKLKSKNINLGTIECQTLHGWIYKNNQSFKLKLLLKDLDIFIIDECSMLSIDIIEMILELISKDCKIILVGDANQLPPINSCSIWNNIFENKKDNLFRYCTVNLSKIYRNSGDIQELSKLIFHENHLNFNRKINDILKSNNSSNVKIEIRNKRNLPDKLKEQVFSFIESLKSKTIKLSNKKYIFDSHVDNLLEYEEDLVSDIFETLYSQLILCSRNKGTWSVEDVNSLVIQQTQPYDFLTFDQGIPIMCIENNNELGISNGDIGVLIGKNKTRRYLFRKFNKDNELVVNLIEPYRLDKIVPALAMTIHKSQGSESEKVIILWNKENKINSTASPLQELKFFRDNYEKRLLYTGITRAKKNLDLFYLE